MAWRMVKDMVPFLSTTFLKYYNEFRRLLTGTASNKTREEICFKYTDEILGPLVGALFIRHAFSPEDKQEVEEMMSLIIKSFEVNAETVDWISKQTIKSVKEKVKRIVINKEKLFLHNFFLIYLTKYFFSLGVCHLNTFFCQGRSFLLFVIILQCCTSLLKKVS